MSAKLPLYVLAAAALWAAAPRAQTAPATSPAAESVAGFASFGPGLTRAEAIETIYERLLTAEDRAGFDLLTGGPSASGLVENAVLVSQYGSANVVDVEQVGVLNLAVLAQEGSGNHTDLYQEGAFNIYGARVVGSGNDLDVSQIGTENVYLLDYRGNALDHTVLQQGDGNQLVQIGVSTAPFSVEQVGDGMVLIIEHNGVGF